MSVEEDLKGLVENFAKDRAEAWKKEPAARDYERMSTELLLDFFGRARTQCKASPDAVNVFRPAKKVSDTTKRFVPAGVGEFIELANMEIARLKVDDTMPGYVDQAKLKITALTDTFVENHPGDADLAETVRQLHRCWESDKYSMKFLDTQCERFNLLNAAAVAVKDIVGQYSRPWRAMPTPADWQVLAGRLSDAKDKQGWCSLLMSYWLDEAGLPMVVERLVDRIENGPSGLNRPLVGVRVEEGSTAANVLGQFACYWQQGLVPAVDERRRQYESLYGFPLHAATGWGRLETIDPRHNFPAAFHGFLAEASRYYQEIRNRFMEADPTRAGEALGALSRELREGNENMRLVRTPEIRASMEYAKWILGGNKDAASARLRDEWKKFLPGRPGVRDGMDPWEFNLDTVTSLMGWKRPPAREYRALAECGETILVFTRILAGTGDAELRDGSLIAFLDLLQNPIQRYAAAYKAVARVDLLAPQPFLGSPADAMARHIPPPAVPPLRRNWAEVPAIA